MMNANRAEPDVQATAERSSGVEAKRLARRHLRLGFWGLLLFLSLGFVLESLHGFKIGFYLDVSNEARRLTWRLAHAHGTLLCILNIIFALTLNADAITSRRIDVSSLGLVLATILIPAGFFVSGIFIHGGDPGLGILLVPLGAVALFAAILSIARAVR